MMAVQVKKLQAYTAARDSLVNALSLAEAAFTSADFSYEPTSDYRKALDLINAILLQLRSLAVNTLKAIDDSVAESDLVQALNAQAKKAKKEADALHAAASTIVDIADVVGKITAVVSEIAGLPFL